MYNLKKIRRKEVVSKDGKIIGKIRGVAVTPNWSIRGLNIKLESDVIETLGFKKPFIGGLKKEVLVADVQALSDNAVLKRSLSELGAVLNRYSENSDAAKLLDMEIVDAEGMDVGRIEGMMINEKNWKVDSIILSIDREVIPRTDLDSAVIHNKEIFLKTRYVASVGDVVMLTRPLKRLAEILELAAVKKA